MRGWRGLGLVTVTTSPAIQTIAQVITNTENASAASNNPGNLMYAGQPGASGSSGHLATFDTYDNGYQAMLRQIQLDANNGMTISDMMNSWAPASVPGNDPVAYAGYVSSALGVDPSTSVSSVFAGGAGNSIPLGTGADTSASDGSAFDLSSLGIDTSSLGDLDWTTIGLVAVGAVVLLMVVKR